MPEQSDTIADRLRALDRLTPVCRAIADVTGSEGGVYLVGGTVRDILLGEASFDFDIAVEGDGIELARRLAAALEGSVVTHSAFGTAVVRYGDGWQIDVVTARSESYPAPAALPVVEFAGLDPDLARRDFTINAIAASLNPADFGRLVDPFHGQRDLVTGTIRVLHERSFEDDPTRVFRAIRYENRYGFRMDERTLELARASAAQGFFGLSGARLREELVALLQERDVSFAIRRLAEIGADRVIHSRLAADEEAVRLATRLAELDAELNLGVPAWRPRLAALAREVPAEEIGPWLDSLGFRRSDAGHIVSAVVVGPQLVDRLAGVVVDPAEIVALAEPHAPDAPLFALALAEVPALREYFTRLRDIALDITGADLAELGLGESPRVGEVLDELRRRKLRGELDGRESELAAARELISG